MYRKWQTSFIENINLTYSPTDKDAESVLGFVENSARVLH